MIPTSRFARPRALLATLVLMALALPALGGTLYLTGTPGARVTVDGRDVGTLPLDGPLILEAGRHDIVAVRPGLETMAVEVVAETETQVLNLHLRLTPLSRRTAVTQSLMLAGSGQRYEGRPTLGWILTGVEAAGLLTALLSEMTAQNHEDEYLLARQMYEESFDADDLAYYKAKMLDEHDSLTRALDLRDAALLAAGGAVVVSVLDALLRFPSAEMRPGPRPVPPADRYSLGAATTHGSRGFHLGWRLGF